METPEGLTIVDVVPRNFERIIELSKTRRSPAYTQEDLEKAYTKAKAANRVAFVMFMDYSYMMKERVDQQ